MIQYRFKYTNTNTNTQIQIHKYKYKFAHTNTNTNTGGAPESNFDILPKNKSFHETAISPEPLDLHRFNTTQIEALGVPDQKNTSGGL